MARAGRKRKAGRRQPSGKLAPEARPDDRIRVSRQPHRRLVPTEARTDERAESPLGRLRLRELITAAQYDAGDRFAAVVGAYRATIESPRATAGSGRGFQCAAEWGGDAAVCQLDPAACTCLARRRAYMRAYEALTDAGRCAVLATIRVVVQREPIAEADAVNLVRGLAALARHFGLREPPPAATIRNANSLPAPGA